MVRGVEEIQTVIDAHRETTQIFQVGHQYNSAELYQKVSQIVQSGYLGEITAFECQWNRNGDWRRPVPHPKWERAINWRMYKENSGGLVAELCSHQIDFICRTLGEAPEVITGFGGIDYWKDGRETFDNVHLLFKYPSGIDASFTCTTSRKCSTQRTWYCRWGKWCHKNGLAKRRGCSHRSLQRGYYQAGYYAILRFCQK